MKKILEILQEIVFGICLVTLLLVGTIALGSKFNIPGGYRIYSVLTGSMEPAVPTGTLIFAKIPSSNDDIKKGDVITFNEPGFQNKFITHRVSEIISQGGAKFYKTKGDANNSPDPWQISYGSIKGVYKTQFIYLGFLLEFLKSPLGIGLFVILPVLFISVLEIKNIFGILLQSKLSQEKLEIPQKSTHHPNYHLLIWPLLLLAPVIIFSVSHTYGLFESNQVKISNNTIVVPIPTSSPTPKPTRTPKPSHTPCPDDESDHISNNGANSNNKITHSEKCDDNSKQSDTTENDINLNSDSNSGTNSASGNTGSVTVNTSSSSATVNVQVQQSTNN